MLFKRVLACGLVSACALISACGGGGSDDPPVTALPASVDITGKASAEVDSASAFGTSITGATTGLKFAWAFGDGGTSTLASPTHAYASGGDYVVTLSVTNEAGVMRTSTFNVTASRLAMVAGTNCTGAAQSGWCWQRPKPTGSAMLDIYFVDASTGWGVGEAGQILKTTDGGATWVAQHSGVTATLTQVRFVDATTGWAVGGGGAVLKTTDGGTTWSAQALGLKYSYAYSGPSLVVIDASRAVVDSGYEIKVTTDGGQHWTTSTIFPTVMTPNGTMWAVNYSGISKSVDLGLTSTVALQSNYLQTFSTVEFADDLHGWVSGTDYSVGYATGFWRTTDGGVSWQRIAAPAAGGYSWDYSKFTSAKVGWVHAGYALFRTTDAGDSWTSVSLPASLPSYSYINRPQALSDTTFWLPSASGGYLTRDSGATWTSLTVAAESTTYVTPRFQLVGANTMLLHFGSRSYRSTDNGVTWTQVLGQDAKDQGGNLLAAWFFDGKKGVAFSSSGALVTTTDSGLTWTRKALTGTSSYGPARLQFASATNGWLLSNSNGNTTISKTSDGGATWLVPLVPVNSFLGTNDFHFVNDDAGWAVTSAGAINHSADGGKSWAAQATLPYALTGVRFITAQIGVVVGQAGLIARTTDGGANWILRASGVTQDLRRAVFVDANNGWAVGSYGTVVKTTDAGVTWTKVAVPSISSLNDVTFIDAQHGWIVGEGGTVLATIDGGRSWQVQASGTDKSLNSAFFIDARSGWLVGADGAILATATGGN